MSNFQMFAARSIIFEYDKLLTSFHLSGKGLKAALALLDAKGSGSSKVNNGTSWRQKGLCLQPEQGHELI